MTATPRLAAALLELERNLYHLRRYAVRLRDIERDRPDLLTTPDDRAVEAIDQFVLRFLKIVDATTRRLFPIVLATLGEREEAMPLIDVLNRMEQLGYLERAIDWRLARDLRNQLTHDYPDAPQKRHAILLAALESAQAIERDGQRILARLGRR
jgi:hypothetical protein